MPQKFKQRGIGDKEEKWCNRCNRWRLLKFFTFSHYRGPGHRRPHCRDCEAVKMKIYRQQQKQRLKRAETIYPILFLCMLKNTLGGDDHEISTR